VQFVVGDERPTSDPRVRGQHARQERTSPASLWHIPGLRGSDRTQSPRRRELMMARWGMLSTSVRSQGEEVRSRRHQCPQCEISELEAPAWGGEPVCRPFHKLLRERSAAGRNAPSHLIRLQRDAASQALGTAGFGEVFQDRLSGVRSRLAGGLEKARGAIRSRSGRLIASGVNTSLAANLDQLYRLSVDDGRNRHQYGSVPHRVLDRRGYRIIRARRDFREDIGEHCVGAATRTACRPISKTGT
jgi:hypothetical protein